LAIDIERLLPILIHAMNTEKSLLIIVSGLPCTGKTTLAKEIAQRFRLPLVTKDGVKELLFDTLGWKDRAWSKQLNLASYSLLFYFMDAQLAAGNSLIVEGNFNPDVQGEKFLELKRAHSYEPLQIQCISDGEVLFERYKRRGESGRRHPGHVDAETYEELKPTLLQGRLKPIDIGGEYIEVDTTDFSQIDYDDLFKTVHAALER
jgi:predicted kinase